MHRVHTLYSSPLHAYTRMMSSVWQYTAAGRLSKTLSKATRAVPSPGEGEIVIKVKAASLNPVEEQLAQAPDRLLQFIGAAPRSPSNPLVPSQDFSGIIHSVGAGVTTFSIGDAVVGNRFAADGNGSLQEYIAVPASAPIVPKPEKLSFAEAAALPLVYITVYDALVEWGKLPFNPAPEDEGKRSVLILGGSSGTGSVGIQLAKKMGLNVVTTCSSANVELVKKLGADEVINYRTQSVAQEALMSRYAPYSVVLDCVGGTDLFGYLDQLILDDPTAPQLGIYVTIVGDKTNRDNMGGAVTNYYYPSQVIRTFRGSLKYKLPWFLRWLSGKRYACIMMIATAEKLATLPAFLDSGVEVLIDSVYPFSDVPKAFERLESGRAKGKVVVEVA